MRVFWFKALGLLLLAAVSSAVPAPAAEAANRPQLLERFPGPSASILTGEATPAGNFEDACGLAVDSQANIYVSDYLHNAIAVFSEDGVYLTQIAGVDPLDGPCGLAVDSAGNVYVNDYHRDVVRYEPSAFPYPLCGASPKGLCGPAPTYDGGTVIDVSHPTGVAIDPATDHLYVSDRTHVSVYDPSGDPVLVAGDPLRIGDGTIGDGFGVAVSAFAATAGRVYVADASDQTVKVYDPAVDTVNPVDVIDGAGTSRGGFVSLFDSSLALDQTNGHVLVADNTQSGFEHPAAAIEEFGPTGLYRDRIAHAIVHGEPVGIALDNSAGPHRGELYVTSGNGTSDVFPAVPNPEESVLYAFGLAGAVGAGFAPGLGTLGLDRGGGGAPSAAAVEPAARGAGLAPAPGRKGKGRKQRRGKPRVGLASARAVSADG